MVETLHDCSPAPSLEYVDRFGRVVGDLLYLRWCAGAAAPSWREVFDSPDVLNFLEQERLPGLHPRMEALMARAAGRGWLAYSDEPRSLRVGPTYLASPGQKLRVRQPRDMGRRVAGAVARFRHKHKHNPTIKEFADFLRNARVQRIFRGEADVLKNLPWLVVSGWIVLEDGRVLRGPTARADMNERAALRRLAIREAAQAAKESEEPGSTYSDNALAALESALSSLVAEHPARSRHH